MTRDGKWLEHLFSFYYLDVISYFRRKGFSRETSQDLTQDVFLKAYQHRSTFRGASSDRAWLFIIAHSIWANEVRHRRASNRSGDEVSIEAISVDLEAGSLQPFVSPESSPEQVFAKKEEQGRLAAAIQALPARQRAVLLLQQQGLAYKEIASALKIRVETVKSLRHDALRGLKRLFGLEQVDLAHDSASMESS